jgi:hypothetical protein
MSSQWEPELEKNQDRTSKNYWPTLTPKTTDFYHNQYTRESHLCPNSLVEPTESTPNKLTYLTKKIEKEARPRSHQLQKAHFLKKLKSKQGLLSSKSWERSLRPDRLKISKDQKIFSGLLR